VFDRRLRHIRREHVGLRIVYRSYGGENLKGRPDFYSKDLCLLSLLRAAGEAGASILFMNDGPIPEPLFSRMQAAGDVVELPRVGMRESYLSALRHAASARWPAEDVVWFSEDDYLYRPESMVQLARAADAVPAADYFALYGDDPVRTDLHPGEDHQVPRGWKALPPWDVGGQGWVRAWSTTSTFGARAGVLREDYGIFRLCTIPHRHMYRDHDTCLVYQGFEPYAYGDLLREAVGMGASGGANRLRAAALAPFKLATNLRAHRRPDRRRMLLTAYPNLATHMEGQYLAAGTDWASVAEDTRKWRDDRGMLEASS
jgi:hypothetical protein